MRRHGDDSPSTARGKIAGQGRAARYGAGNGHPQHGVEELPFNRVWFHGAPYFQSRSQRVPTPSEGDQSVSFQDATGTFLGWLASCGEEVQLPVHPQSL